MSKPPLDKGEDAGLSPDNGRVNGENLPDNGRGRGKNVPDNDRERGKNVPDNNRGRGKNVPDNDRGRGKNFPDNGDAARSRRVELLRYAGLSSQVVAAVGLSVFLGVKADKWLKLSFPILSWALPLLVIVGLLINLIKAGSGKKNGK